MWDTVESLTIFLVYRPPNAPADALLNLLELVAEWALRFSRLLVLGDFNVQVDKASSLQDPDLVSAMATLGLTQFVTGPTHQAGYTPDLIFGMGICMDTIQKTRVP